MLRKCENDKCYDHVTTQCGECPKVDCKSKEVLDHVPVSCQKYYICLGNTENPVPVTCPSTQHYSVSEKKCMSPVEAKCQTADEWCTNQKDGTVFPAERCYDYYECKMQENFLKSCPYNQYFDKQNGTCVTGICSNQDGTTSERLPTCTADTDGIKMAHPKCYQYYMCLKQVLYVAQCPSGYYFNDQSKNCVKDVNDECNDS